MGKQPVAVGRWFHRAGLALAVAVVYYASGKLSLKLAFVHPSATPVWPPAGIALAAVLIFGSWIWPAIFAGAFLVNITTAGSVATSTGIALANVLEALLGAFLVERHARGVEAFQRPGDVFRFALLAGLIATSVSPPIGVTSLCLGGYAPWSEWGSIWLTSWLGDAGGIVIVAPLLVLWATDSTVIWRGRRRAIEAAALLLVLGLVGSAVFGPLLPIADRRYPLEFLCFPILVWAAFRFGPRETATAAFILAGIAIWGTLLEFGSFARETPNESLILLQAFITAITVMALGLATAVAEQTRTHEALQEGQAQLRTLERMQPRRRCVPASGHSPMRKPWLTWDRGAATSRRT